MYVPMTLLSMLITVNFFPDSFLFPISSFVLASVATARVWYLQVHEKKKKTF